MHGNEFLNTSLEDVCDYLEQKYRLDPPRLKRDAITVDQVETEVDVSRDIRRAIRDRSRPFLIKGTHITYYVPFDGDPNLLRCQPPSSFRLNPPRATVRGNEILVAYVLTDHNAESIKQEFDQCVAEIEKYLKTVEKDVSAFNAEIRKMARGKIEVRRDKLLADQGLIVALGFPLRERKDSPRTFVPPEIRKKVASPRPSGEKSPFVPEPALDMQNYEHILSVVCNMVSVMERSPKAFSGMKEEHLRDHFLVQLNGHYEGQATGETFNFEGKTDILIRMNGKNIFIAECKFWKGQKYLENAIDQLLGYASWRDTKTAILVFNRERNFSDVVAKIPEIVKSHSNFKRQLDYEPETGFRFALHHRDDVNRELILTVLAFEVPK